MRRVGAIVVGRKAINPAFSIGTVSAMVGA